MLARGMDPNADVYGGRFLLKAIKWGCDESVELLIEAGASLDVQPAGFDGPYVTAKEWSVEWAKWGFKTQSDIRKGLVKPGPGFARRKEGIERIYKRLHGKSPVDPAVRRSEKAKMMAEKVRAAKADRALQDQLCRRRLRRPRASAGRVHSRRRSTRSSRTSVLAGLAPPFLEIPTSTPPARSAGG